MVAAVSVPVTVKMRLGWTAAEANAPALAQLAESLGAALVTVHGRTRDQFYAGVADWRAIRAVRDAVRIPLLVNGDIASAEDARAALALSGADAVMVGRAATGRPWLPGGIAAALAGREPPAWTADERASIACEHYEGLLSEFGREAGVRHARKHVAAYVAHAPAEDAALRQRAVTSAEPAEVLRLLRAAFGSTPERLAA